MSLNDPLSNALSHILNCERVSKTICNITPASKTIKIILELLNKEGYIGSYELVKNNKKDILKLNLLGKINKCGAIKPKFSIKENQFEKYERRFLPAKDFGVLILTTSKGIMTNKEAKDKKVGGKLLAYCY